MKVQFIHQCSCNAIRYTMFNSPFVPGGLSLTRPSDYAKAKIIHCEKVKTGWDSLHAGIWK